MKSLARDVAIAFLLGVIVPAAAIQMHLLFRRDVERDVPQAIIQEPVSVEPEKAENPRMILFRAAEGPVSYVELEEYIVGAVLGEMPAYFEPEALKAQAVAARTYACKAQVSGGKHGDGSVCADFSCCQAYISEEQYLAMGGDVASVQKIRSAVRATENLVLTYEGALIEATYFSCSGGKTEDAVAVWGNDYPYLRSVESPGEEHALYYRDEAAFSRKELEQALGLTLPEDPDSWFGEITYTQGEGVDTIRIGDSLFSGTMLRRLLNLRSTAFSLRIEEDAAVFATRGYGHRVGMSQYGADAMAASGATFAEILSHYYPGTELEMLR